MAGHMQTSWTLFEIGGIPIRADLSLGLLLLLLFWQVGSLTEVFVVAVVLLLSILLHELAHSAVAIAFGGRVHSITLQVLGGCAMVTRMPEKDWQEALMAFAGPACSLLLAAIGWVLADVFATRLLDPYTGIVYVQENLFFSVLAGLNLGLGCFNLIPAFPMDGGRILRSLLQVFHLSKVRATEIAVWVGQGIAILWVVQWVIGLCFGVHLPCPAGAPDFVALFWGMLFNVDSFILPLIAYMVWMVGKRELAFVRAGGWR